LPKAASKKTVVLQDFEEELMPALESKSASKKLGMEDWEEWL